MRFVLIFTFLFQSLSSAELCNQQIPAGFSPFSKLAEMTTDLCNQHLKIFSNLNDLKFDDEQLSESVAQSDLIILAEEHLNPYQRHYDRLFMKLKMDNPKIDCVFLEFNKNDPNAKKMIEGDSSLELNYRQHNKLIESAKRSQTKIFFVDERDPNIKVSDGVDKYVKQSNEAIYKNIKALYDSKDCEAGILVVGKAHVETPQLPINPINSLKTMFENSQFSSTAINLVYTSKNVLKDPRDAYDYEMKWKICEQQSQEFTPISKSGAVSKKNLNSTPGMSLVPVDKIDYYLFMPKVEVKEVFEQ